MKSIEASKNIFKSLPNNIQDAIDFVNKADDAGNMYHDAYFCGSQEYYYGDINLLFKLAKCTKYIQLGDEICRKQVIEYINSNPEVSKKFVLSTDGDCLINLDNIDKVIGDGSFFRIDVNDLKRIDLEKLRQGENHIEITFKSFSDFSISFLEKMRQANINIEGIKALDETGDRMMINSVDNISGTREDGGVFIFRRL